LIRRAVDWVRRQEPFHALDVSCRRAVAHIHVAATDPLRTGRHPDLVAHAVIADRCACGVAAMKEVVARKLRIIPARVADAVMNGVVPVVIVIGGYSVPAAIMRLKRVMRPANTGIGARNHNVLPGESQCPYLWRVRVTDARLDCGRSRRLVDNRARLRQVIVNTRVAFHARHVRPSCHCFSDIASGLHQNCINDVKRLIFDAAFL